MANPFDPADDDLDEDETGTDGETGAASKNFTDLRKWANKRDREAKTFEKELEGLRDFKLSVESKQRIEAVKSAFDEVGLNPKHAALFAKLNGENEVTVDTVKAFAAEYELPTVQGEQVVTPDPKASGFTPVVTGATPDPSMLSLEDAQKLIREGKYDEAQKLYESGRIVKMERDANGAPVVDWLEGVRRS
jgi:hypothetical protein